MAAQNVIAELLVQIGLDASDAEKSAKRIQKDLEKVKGSADKAAKATDKTDQAFRRMAKGSEIAGKVARGLAVTMGAVATGVGALGKSVIETGASFEKLRAQLKTATGSAEGAEKALGFIRDFAKNTPFQVTEITEAFVKLTNLGLEPSRRALTSYGDTASAMGKSLDQFIEAVADATTGEFERLKEFGIKSRSEGDRVAFTFRGITTEVGKNSAEIQEFLIGLGENNFAGAMAEQMGTLGGIISNLKDAFTDFLLSVAEMGPLEEFKALVADLRDASGDKEGLAKTLARTLVTAIRTLRRALKGDLVGVLKSAAESVAFVVENFDKLVFLFGAAKTFQAFNAVAQGFRAMGIAASASLGPIGAIASALIAIIPIAIDAGNAIGDAISKDRNLTRVKTRGGGTAGVSLGEQQSESSFGSVLSSQTDDLRAAERQVAALEAEGAGRIRMRMARDRQRDAQSRLKATQAKAAAEVNQKRAAAKASAEREAQAAAARAKEDATDAAEFGGFDRDLASISSALGIEGEASGKQAARLERATLALAEGKSLKEARKAAGLDRRRGGGGRRTKAKAEKQKAKVTSPTSVSEFFGAAARGELGPIAARTPSTADIEPTVAVDITNNNFNFADTFNITGTADPAETGKNVVMKIKEEFDRRLATAGQSMATNVVR